MASESSVFRRPGRGLALALALMACSLPAAALAQPSAADRETARTLMKQGDERFAAKDFAAALKAYQGAHAIMKVPSTGLAVAKAQAERGLLIEARETLLDVGRMPKEAGEAAALTKARDEAAALAQKLADRIPSVILALEGPADGVEVQVDGAVVPAATLGAPRRVNPGPHVITASGARGSATVNVVVKEGATEKVDLRLGAGGGAVTSRGKPGGTLIHVISPSEPGNVILDGKAVGATPLDVPVTPGKHEVEIEYPGGTHDKKVVDVSAGHTADVAFSPSTLDSIARLRKGVRFGLSGAPMQTVNLDGGSPLHGGAAGWVMNIGITPMFDFRTGVSAAFLRRSDGAMHIRAMVPALLKVNLNNWYSFAAGLTAGFVTDGDHFDSSGNISFRLGGMAGPEWSPVIMSAGDKRQFELAVMQGFRFGSTRFDFHQAVMFTYLLLD